MSGYGLILGLNPKKAMNKGVADVPSHVEHARRNGHVFWDRNAKIKDDDQRRLDGGYLYLWEAGGTGIRYRFKIEAFYDGQDEFEHLLEDPRVSKYLTPARKYDGVDKRKILAGEKCGTFILLKDPEEVGHLRPTDFKKVDGTRVKTEVVRGPGIFVKVV